MYKLNTSCAEWPNWKKSFSNFYFYFLNNKLLNDVVIWYLHVDILTSTPLYALLRQNISGNVIQDLNGVNDNKQANEPKTKRTKQWKEDTLEQDIMQFEWNTLLWITFTLPVANEDSITVFNSVYSILYKFNLKDCRSFEPSKRMPKRIAVGQLLLALGWNAMPVYLDLSLIAITSYLLIELTSRPQCQFKVINRFYDLGRKFSNSGKFKQYTKVYEYID